MDSEPLPDHYKALGVDRTADTQTIKAAHRKLVLGCHPDKVKVTDPVIRQQKQEEFHRIQKAYEVLTDDKERATYEANLTLEKLRKEKLARGGAPSSREKSTRFDPRTSTGTSARYATEERRPSAAYDDDKYYDERDRDRARGSARSKYDTWDAYPKSGSSPRTEKESSRSAKASTDRSRSDRNKARDKEERRERKFVSVESESSADEKARYEADYKRRSQEDEARRQAADARRKAEDRRSYEDSRYGSSSSARKMSTQEEEAIRYLHKSRAQVEAEIRPTPHRSSSRDYYGDSSRSSRKESRPEAVRRSSARPKDRPSSSSTRDRDRGFPEIVEWGGEDSSSRRPPTLKQHNSSPANIEVPRAMPQRAYTVAEPSRDHHRSSNSPPPAFHRSQTMPSVSHSSSRSKPATVSRPSTLRETMTPEHSSPERDFPSVPPPQPSSASKTKYYHYPTPNGGVPLRQEDLFAGSHRTVLREPGSQRHRSPSPLTRPPIGPNRPSEANIHKPVVPPPPMGRSSSSRNVSPVREERGRSSRPLYGEFGRDSARPRATRQNSFNPNEVQYATKYGPEDVRWAPRGRENDREYASKPTLGRTATYVY